MLHFLPQHNRKEIIAEYALRVSICLLLLVFISLLIAASLFLPSFFFSKYKDQTVTNQLDSLVPANADSSSDPTVIIKNINAMVKVLSAGENNSLSASALMGEILSLKDSHIEISAIAVSETDAVSKNITVSGTADTRDDLTTFYNALKGDGTFQSVVLPVSTLIQDSNADFSITLTYKNNSPQ